MAYRSFLALLLLILVGISPFESVLAQNGKPFSERAAGWSADMDIIERLVTDIALTPDSSESIKRTLARIIGEAQDAKAVTTERLADLQTRLDALGETSDVATPEQAAVKKERTRLQKAIADANSQVALADLAIARANGLNTRIGQAQRTRLVEQLSEQGPLPYDPQSLADVPKGIADYLSAVAKIASDWWKSLRPDQRRFSNLFQPFLLLVLGLGVAWWIRRFILAKFGHYPVTEPPPYSRRLLGAIADGVAKGILPAALLAIVMIRARSESSFMHGDFGTLIGLGAETLMIFVLATALPLAALSPHHPAWRITQLRPQNGLRIQALITPLALLYCIDDFVTESVMSVDGLNGVLSPGFLSTWSFVFNLAQGMVALALLRPSLWGRDETVPDDPLDSETAKPAEDGESQAGDGDLRMPFVRSLHLLLILITVVGMIAPALGYTTLGNYLLNNMLGTSIILSILYLVRGLFRDLIGLAAGSHFLKESLDLSHKTRSRLKFISRLGLDVVIILGGLGVIAPGWGVSEADLLRTVQSGLSELTIGNVTISITDIALAILVFVVTLALIRVLKQNLAERILPETQIEESLRHSITAGIGYVGFVVAGGLAVAVAGVDLTNIALIAGALSVGIGFGLQNIVNNFVSGLILLIERPIKVGDWVVVGSNEGFVKQINMRATEIETWNRASVIVPNADLLSKELKNWTHKDRSGRVDIPIGVAYGSDIDKVTEVLLEIANAHPRCRRFPEAVALVTGFGESQIDMQLRLFTSDILWGLWISSDIRKEVLKRFRDEGIEIPFAQRVLHLSADAKADLIDLKSVSDQAPPKE